MFWIALALCVVRFIWQHIVSNTHTHAPFSSTQNCSRNCRNTLPTATPPSSPSSSNNSAQSSRQSCPSALTACVCPCHCVTAPMWRRCDAAIQRSRLPRIVLQQLTIPHQPPEFAIQPVRSNRCCPSSRLLNYPSSQPMPALLLACRSTVQ